MSDAFQDREKGFERKYEFDEQQRFKALARRDRLFGAWAAGLLGYTGTEAETYTRSVIDANFERPGEADMLGKVARDLAAAKVAMTDRDIKNKLFACEQEAAKQVATG